MLRRIYGLTQEGRRWRPRWNNELYTLYKDLNIVEDIKTRILGWAGHIMRMEEERITKKIKDPKWSLLQHKTSGKAKNQMGGRGPERCIATIRNEKMEEKSKKW